MVFYIYKDIEREGEEVLFDDWAIIHFLSGFFMFFLFEYLKINRLYAFIIFFIIHLIYEIKDQLISGFELIYNSKMNSIGDQLAATVGYLIPLFIIVYFKIKVENIHVLISLIIYIILSLILGYKWTQNGYAYEKILFNKKNN